MELGLGTSLYLDPTTVGREGKRCQFCLQGSGGAFPPQQQDPQPCGESAAGPRQGNGLDAPPAMPVLPRPEPGRLLHAAGALPSSPQRKGVWSQQGGLQWSCCILPPPAHGAGATWGLAQPFRQGSVHRWLGPRSCCCSCSKQHPGSW